MSPFLRDLTSLDWALRTAKRASGEDLSTPFWSDDEWLAELHNHSLIRDGRLFFNPYAAALVFASNPRQLSSKQEGSVQEQYTPPAIVVAQLQELSASVIAEVNALTLVQQPAQDLTLDIRGW